MLVEGLGWGLPAKGLAGPGVEGVSDCLDLLSGPAGQVGALGEVLTQQPIGVLVRPALPRRLRVGEEDRDGKSSISYSALVNGIPVHASELAFVQDASAMCGNSALTIDRAAVDLFDLGDLVAHTIADGSRLAFGMTTHGPVKISRVAFPQVHPGRLQIRPITSRRARMLLFENVVTQLPLVQLLAQETWPVWDPPERAAVERLMEEVIALSVLDPVAVSGHPREIAEAVAAGLI